MKERCDNPADISYHNYGARGITIAPEWRSFEVFLKDMGERPEDCSLDRVDSSLSYCASNCKWATRKEQSRNQRTNRVLLVDGEHKLMTEWSEIYGVLLSTIWARLDRGWESEAAVKTPPHGRARSDKGVKKKRV